MRYPKELNIGGHTYKVNFLEASAADYGGASWGSHHGQNFEIRIALLNNDGSRRANTAIQVTFLHELVHAIDKIYLDNQLKEEWIGPLSQGLLQILNQLLEAPRCE